MTPTFIMAIPWDQSRLKRALQLRKETDGVIVFDEERNAFHTFRLVLNDVGEGPAIILEDDVTLTDGWREKIEAALEDHRNDVVQFFNLRNIEESRYEPARTFLMNQCYYLPAGAAQDLLEFTNDWVENNPDHPTGYDIAMGAWMASVGRKYWMSVPSLVQHEKWRSEINPKRSSARQSKDFS